MHVLAVDPGGRRVGLAFGDTLTGVAVPLRVVEVASLAAAVAAVHAVARVRHVELVVIGLPTDLEGNETPACRRSRALGNLLRDLGLATAFQPEVLTSDEARRRARLAGRSRHAATDDLAAQVLLEEYLAGASAGGPS